jgi:hypothetical protein
MDITIHASFLAHDDGDQLYCSKLVRSSQVMPTETEKTARVKMEA